MATSFWIVRGALVLVALATFAGPARAHSECEAYELQNLYFPSAARIDPGCDIVGYARDSSAPSTGFTVYYQSEIATVEVAHEVLDIAPVTVPSSITRCEGPNAGVTIDESQNMVRFVIHLLESVPEGVELAVLHTGADGELSGSPGFEIAVGAACQDDTAFALSCHERCAETDLCAAGDSDAGQCDVGGCAIGGGLGGCGASVLLVLGWIALVGRRRRAM